MGIDAHQCMPSPTSACGPSASTALICAGPNRWKVPSFLPLRLSSNAVAARVAAAPGAAQLPSCGAQERRGAASSLSLAHPLRNTTHRDRKGCSPSKLLPPGGVGRLCLRCAHLTDCRTGDQWRQRGERRISHSPSAGAPPSPPPCGAPRLGVGLPQPFCNPASCCCSMAVQQRLKALGRKLDRLDAAESMSPEFWMEDFAGTWEALVQLNNPPENGPAAHRQRLEVLR